MGFNLYKLMLDSALNKIGAKEIKIQYIFENQSAKVTLLDGKIIDSTKISGIKDMAVKKIAEHYKNGKFLTVIVSSEKITGEVLNIDGTKEEINFKF